MSLNSLSGYVSCRVASYSMKKIIPAYGKKFSGAALKKALKAGEQIDFLHSMSGSYFSAADVKAVGGTLNVRFNEDRDIAVVKP